MAPSFTAADISVTLVVRLLMARKLSFLEVKVAPLSDLDLAQGRDGLDFEVNSVSSTQTPCPHVTIRSHLFMAGGQGRLPRHLLSEETHVHRHPRPEVWSARGGR